MKWSDRQLAIFDAYENTRKNIAIEATAGSSKTTCIVECCRRTPPNKKVLFMAFNKSIAEELRERLPSHIDVNTFHSKGLRVLLSNFRIKPKINENKCFVIGKKILDTKDMDVKQQIRYLFEIQIIWNYIRVNLITDYEKEIPGICIEKNIEFQERMVGDMEQIRNAWHKEMKKINSVKEINIDFTDMLYFPYQLLDSEDFPKYDVVVTDECFPGDQRILVEGGKDKILRIYKRFCKGESIKAKSFNIEKGVFEYKNILNMWNRGVRDLVRITVAGKRKIKCTPNHPFLTDYGWIQAKDLKKGYVLLSDSNTQPYHPIPNMEQLEVFQASIIGDGSLDKLMYNINRCGFVQGEAQKDYLYWKAWLFQQTNVVKRIEENGFAKTPAYIFTTKGLCIDEGCIDKFKIAENLTIKQLAILYMDDGSFGKVSKLYSGSACKELCYKLCERINKLGFACKVREAKSSSTDKPYWFIEFSMKCNDSLHEKLAPYIHPCLKYKILEKYHHLVGTYKWNNEYFPLGGIIVDKVEEIEDKEEVYDIEVEDNHNFLICGSSHKGLNRDAGIIVHNCQDFSTIQKELSMRYIKKSGRFVVVGDSRQCIYGFQGSSLEVFKSLQSYPNTIVLPLDITYRCGKNIVEEARKVFDNGIVAAPNAIDGVVRKGEFDEAENGDFILCRNNLPLATVFLYLLEMGKKATIKGKDYGDALVALVDKIKHIEDLDAMCERKISELKERGFTDIQAKNNPSYVTLLEKCTILKMLYKNWGDMKKLEDNIKEIYKDDTEGIVLSTIHKSKGLEADRVFLLNRSLIPSKYANTEEALYNEKCLLFVAITRARKELVYCNV